MMRCIVLNTGWCRVAQGIALRGAPAGQHWLLPSVVALVQHPQSGWILFDTGYAPRLHTATARLPWKIYAYAAPFVARPNRSLAAQLEGLGLSPADIRLVILSHLHADHVAGLRDIPRVPVLLHADAWADLRGRRGLAALRRAYIPALLPPDLPARVRLLTARDFCHAPLPGLGATRDLFGDGLLRLVPLPGHARGQIGLLAQTTAGAVLFVGDGCLVRENYQQNVPPAPIAATFVASYRGVCATVHNVHHVHQMQPDTLIVPSHCVATWRSLPAALRAEP